MTDRDHRGPKLGKHSPKIHPKTLQFSKYLTADAVPSPASKVYREYRTPPGAKLMYGNDVCGDCTCAAAANHIILTTVHSGTIFVPPVQDVLDMYSTLSGYDQKTQANDNGLAMTDVLEYLRTTGLSGHKIIAWAKIDQTNLLHRQIACDFFGCTFVGVQLPQSAMNQFSSGQNWELLSDDGGAIGGHCILRPGYGSLGDDYVTWAKWDQKASSAWGAAYIDEEYVIVTSDWVNQVTQQTPGGLSLDTLLADLKTISA